MPSALTRLAADAPGRKTPRRGDGARLTDVKRRSKGRGAANGATRKQRASKPARRQPSIWLNRALVLAAALVVVAAGIKAWLTLEQLPVQRITVTGQLEHTQAEAVQELVQASLSGGFLGADLQQMRRELEGLPWIFEVSVRRKWPSALEINVVEQLPIARWGAQGFLNHEGGVFTSKAPGDWESLPVLRGPEGSAPGMMATYQRLLEILAPLGLAVEELHMDARGQMDAVLTPGLRLVLGGDEFRERMQRFVSLYRHELAQRIDEVERVDLRYAAGAAVAFKEPPAVQVAGS